MVDTSKHVWEGWTVRDFITELEPSIRMIQNPLLPTMIDGFKTSDELKEWLKDNQPYYKKHIPEVFNYFKNKLGL